MTRLTVPGAAFISWMQHQVGLVIAIYCTPKRMLFLSRRHHTLKHGQMNGNVPDYLLNEEVDTFPAVRHRFQEVHATSGIARAEAVHIL